MPFTATDLDPKLLMLQAVYNEMLEENPITVDTQLAGLNKKKGQDDYVEDLAGMSDTYSKNTSRILDYLILHFTAKINEFAAKYQSLTAKVYHVPLDVMKMMKPYVNPAIEYLDDMEKIPHITSERIYKKVAYLTWFLQSVVNWANSNEKMFKTIIEKFIQSQIKPLEKRLNAYEKKHKLSAFSFDAIEKELNAKLAVIEANAIAAENTPAANGHRFFSMPSSPVASAAANSPFKPEDEKKTALRQ